MSSFILPCRRVGQRLLTPKKNSCCPGHVSNIPSHIRCISSSLPISAQSGSVEHDPLKPKVEEDEDLEDVEEKNPITQAAYQSWLAGQGRHYKHPSFTGPKWLGGNVVCRLCFLICLAPFNDSSLSCVVTIAVPTESNVQTSASIIR